MAALNGLPRSYEGLLVAFDAVGYDAKSFTFDVVKSRLLQEEQRALERDPCSGELKPSALFPLSGRNGTSSPKRENKYANIRCRNCGNPGHTSSHCGGKDVDGGRPPKPRALNGKDKIENTFREGGFTKMIKRITSPKMILFA